MKPNLFIVGAPKCGTTAWYQYLGEHRDIFFPALKEPHYFCTDFPRYRTVRNEADYLDLFKDAAGSAIVGEASVRYLYSEESAKNIHAFNPAAKILVFVREQSKYLPSQHNQMLLNGTEFIEDFETAWRLSGKRDPASIPPSNREAKFLNYAACGRFSEQIQRYLRYFPADQVRVFDFDDWTRNPRAIYLEILRFLGVADDGRTDFPPVNEARHHASLGLMKWTRSPPRWLKALVERARKALGVEGFGIANLIGRLTTRKGMRTAPISPQLREEIREYYRADNAKLSRLVWRPGS